MRAGVIRTIEGVVSVNGARGKAQVEAIARFVDDAAHMPAEAGPIRGEVFRFGNAGVQSALEGALAQGVPVRLLADSGQAIPQLGPLSAKGATVSAYGVAGADDALRGADFCMHSKLWSRGDRAILPTASAGLAGEHQLNITFGFSGDAARAAGEVTEAAISGDPARKLASLQQAREAGLLLNEPTVGTKHVDEGMALAIDNAERNLSLVIKEFTVPAWADRLAAAKGRGVDVKVLTREMSPEVRTILERAGIHEETVPFSNTPWLREILGQRLHFNAVLADMPDAAAVKAGSVSANPDGHAIIGTRYLWDPSRQGERTAREVAVALDGDNALAAQRAVEDHVGLNHLQVLAATIRGR